MASMWRVLGAGIVAAILGARSPASVWHQLHQPHDANIVTVTIASIVISPRKENIVKNMRNKLLATGACDTLPAAFLRGSSVVLVQLMPDGSEEQDAWSRRVVALPLRQELGRPQGIARGGRALESQYG